MSTTTIVGKQRRFPFSKPRFLCGNKNRWRRSRTSRIEQLEARQMLIGSDWNNVLNPLNTTGDTGGFVAPNDVLVVVNEINGPRVSDPVTGKLNVVGQGGFSPPPYHDVNCDTFVSPSDVLRIVNFLNGTRPQPGWKFAESGGSGEGAGAFTNESCAPLLREGNSLITSLVSDFVVPEGASAISFEFESLNFDQSSQGSVRDAFEAALLDTSGQTAVHTLDVGGDSYFNITEGLAASLTSATTQTGNKVSLSLANVLPGTEAQLVVRLVNNDGDTESSVLIKSLQIEFAQGRSATFGGNGSVSGSAATGVSANSSNSAASGAPSAATVGQPTTLTPPPGAIPGRAPTGDANVSTNADTNSDANGKTLASLLGEGNDGSVIDSRGTEFWIGFPDNLRESTNTPQKSLFITGDVATTGFVEIPGLIDPDTTLPFRAEFAVNPGEVTSVELPSNDTTDNANDDQSDFDVEAELVAQIEHRGVHVVALDPVTVYGISRAVNTTDAFLALPIDSLGTEYINLGYGNTHRLTSNPIGSQFLIVATEDDTQVDIVPGEYTFPVATSDARIFAPSGTTPLGAFSNSGTDIGPFLADQSGDWSLKVIPPFDAYSGNYRFELVDVAAAATSASLDEIVTVNFPTGREAKVISFDVTAGQQLYYDVINPDVASGSKVLLFSPSGSTTTLNTTDDTTLFNVLGPLQFAEEGTHYVLIVGEKDESFDFQFQLIDIEQTPTIAFGTSIGDVFDPAGRTSIYQFDGQVSQRLFMDSLDADNKVNVTIYGPGGQKVVNTTTNTDVLFELPETATYYAVFSSASFATSSFEVVFRDLADVAELPADTPANFSFSGGSSNLYRVSGQAGQTLDNQNMTGSNLFRTQLRLFDPTGKQISVTTAGNSLDSKLLITGDYLITVGGVSHGDVGDGSFEISVIADAPVAKSGMNAVQTLTIAAGETASYQFSAPAGTPFLLDGLDTASENLNVELKAPDGTRLYTGFGFATELQDLPTSGPTHLPQSGTYTITLSGKDATAAGSYSFRAFDFETFPTLLNLGETISQTLPMGREVLLYAFDALAGQQLSLDAKTNATIPLQLYDPQLQVLAPTEFFGRTAGSDGVFRVVHSGRHYVMFTGTQGAPVDISFSVSDWATAPQLDFGQRARGTLSPGRSRVDFRISLEAGQRIRYESMVETSHAAQVKIMNAGGRVIHNTNANVDSGAHSYFFVPETDEYFVSIHGGQDADVNYDFRIDNFDLAPIIDFDTDTTITLDPPRETQVFRFQANVGDVITVDNVGASSQPFNWRVVGEDRLSRRESNSGQDLTASAIKTGTYYLVIAGNREISPIEFRVSRTHDAGPTLSGVNEVVDLPIGIRETGEYTFTTPIGRFLYLNVIHTEFGIRPHTVNLQHGETYLLQDQRGGLFSFNPDLTGSIISSNHPIAVLGGNRCTFVPTQQFACDHLIEQMPPTNTWGREFVTMPLATGTTVGDRFRFLAQTDGTEVTLNGEVIATLNRGQFHEQILTEPAYVKSNGPILVAQYAHSQSFYQQAGGGDPAFLGDPFMVLVPPFEQFLNSYTVSTPAEDSIPESERFDRNFINVLAPSDIVGQIELDGVAIDASEFTAIGDSGFSGAQVAIALGSYSLAGPLPFGVFVYGFGSFDSYGYTGGQALSPVADVGSVLLTPDMANPQVNNSITFTARIADDLGGPIEGIRVDFDVAGVNPRRGFGFSDAAGNVQFSYIGNNMGRDIVTASVGQLLDDSIIDWRTDAAPPQITVISPTDGSQVPAGTTLVASGSECDYRSAHGQRRSAGERRCGGQLLRVALRRPR